MRFWLEMSTPKEVLFFKDFIPELLDRGHDYFITSREYQETNDLIDYFNLKACVVGTHGGKPLYEKLVSGAERIKLLSDLVGDADVLITLCNPEACRTAFGLGIPVVNFIDIPEADKVCRLTLPLSKIVFTPFHVPEPMVRKYWDGDIIIYDCLDPVAWMPKESKLINEIWDKEVTYPFVIYRPGETKAAYYPEKDDITIPIIEGLKKIYPTGTFMPVPRYGEHKMIDMQNLLYHADLFVGGGGTMNIEAAYWGTWTIACRPLITTYDKWMEDNYLQTRANTIEDGINASQEMLRAGIRNTNSYKLRTMRFPLKEIIAAIEKHVF